MSENICRVCLCTEKTLRELNDTLADFYLQDICKLMTNSEQPLCCYSCERALKSNLDFKNRCIKSNFILQEWKSSKTKDKPPIEMLHKFLQTNNHTNTESDTNKSSHQNEEKYYNKVESMEEAVPSIKVVECGTNLTNSREWIINKNEKDYEIVENKIEISLHIDNDDRVIDYDNEEIDSKTDIAYDIGKYDERDSVTDDEKIESKIDVSSININYDSYDQCNDKNDEDKSDNKASKDNVKDVETGNELDDESNSNISDATESDEEDYKYLLKLKEELKKMPNIKDKAKPQSKRRKIEKKKPNQRKGIEAYAKYASVFDIEVFSTDEEARREVAQRRLSEPYLSAQHRCTHCYTVYKCERLLQFHMKWHDPAAEAVCDICSMRFQSRMPVLRHKSKCHRGRFSCKLCPLVTYYESAMKSHFEQHQGKTYECHCGRVYNHCSTYLSHLRTAHPSEHVCVTCAQTFISEKGLVVHRKKVHGLSSKYDADATVRCEPCDLTFTTQQIYNVHVLNTDKHKDIAGTLTACQDCGKEFLESEELRAHRRSVHPSRSWAGRGRRKTPAADRLGQKCPLCGQIGTYKSWLHTHFREAHPAEDYEMCARNEARSHLCDQCGKSFYSVTALKDHANVHTGYKPFQCDKCPAAFRAKTRLKLHMAVHAPPSKECPHCGKKFVSASNLHNHLRFHIRDRRYKCTYCGKGFLHNSSLREHVRGVHHHIRRPRRPRPDEH